MKISVLLNYSALLLVDESKVTDIKYCIILYFTIDNLECSLCSVKIVVVHIDSFIFVAYLF